MSPWSIGEVLLELLSATFFIGLAIVAFGTTNKINQVNNNSIHASEYRKEYATLSVYEGSEIAYTEVLNCTYTHSRDYPIIIIKEDQIDADDIYANADVVFNGIDLLTYAELSDLFRIKSLTYNGELMRRPGGTIIAVRFSYAWGE